MSCAIGVNLTLKGRLETASPRDFTHGGEFQTLNFALVRAGGETALQEGNPL
jgi:hypothetical protein